MSEPAAANGAVSTGGLVVRAALRTDVGLVRSENQDFGTFTTPEEESDSHPGGRLLIVADGMGGHRGGATASRLAGETVKAQYLGSETTDVQAALREALLRANARIFHEAQGNPELRGMGTTASALAVRHGEAWFGHVGDSRIYLIRGDEIKQLTDDHSLVASMVREGLLTTKEAEVHPRRNVLQRSMGVAEHVEIDVRGPFRMVEGDTFILCSDGLHGLVKEEEMKEVAQLPIEQAADEYLKRALERGAPDNVTVIVARVERSADAPAVPELGDETMAVDPFEETVRDDESLFDETQELSDPNIDTVPLAAPTAEELAAADAKSRATADTLEIEKPSLEDDTLRTRRRAAGGGGSPFLKWMLLVVLVLGAAGAWLYWNR